MLALTLVSLWAVVLRPTARERAIVAGARSCLGDAYDASATDAGPPQEGRGACTDVVYSALLPDINLQTAVNTDAGLSPRSYPDDMDPNLGFRWCPTLIRWFERNATQLSVVPGPTAFFRFRPGDVVFYDDGAGRGVPGHVGVVSDRLSWDGTPLLIHNPAPVCAEENALFSNQIVGHFRLK